MKPKLFLVSAISVSTFVVQCKSESEKEKNKLQDNLQTYFNEKIKDSTATLDSFQLVKVDTISQKLLLNEQSNVLGNQLESLIEIYKLNTQSASASVDQMKLYQIIESSDLAQMEKKEVKEKLDKGNEMKNEIDTLMAIINKIVQQSKSADSIQPVGFQAKCAFQVRKKDRSVLQDTAYILLNRNKDIVDRTDFLKLPYSVDFEKFD